VRLFRLVTVCVFLLLAFVSQVTAAENLLRNPTFTGAEETIPPQGWKLYGQLHESNTITVVDADNPEERALHIVDGIIIDRGLVGQIGLTQNVPAQPNQAYRVSALVKALPGVSTDGAFLQLRFMPSGKLQDLPLANLSADKWQEVSIEGVSPADTKSISVYIWTGAKKSPQILLRQVLLEELNSDGAAQPTAKAASADETKSSSTAMQTSKSVLPVVPPLPADHASRHPSILVRSEDVQALRALRRTAPYSVLYSYVLPKAESAFVTPLPDEPEPYPSGWEVNNWRKMRAVATQVSDTLEALGFAYLVTGQERYAAEAKRWIKHVCGWDVNGTTSTAYHDDLGRWIVSSMSLAVDWIYDTLTPEELAEIRSVLLARGRELYQVQVQKLAADPYQSHVVSSLTYITRAALVLSDIPEAQQWLDFSLRFFQEKYPPWGGDDGGWSEGLNYWRFSMNLALEAAEMFRAAGLTDLYQKEWYKNTGYFQMYFMPSGSATLNAFGDGSMGKALVSSDFSHITRLAGVMQDPYLKWHAQKMAGMFDSPMAAYLFFYRYGDTYRELNQVSASDLSRSRAFYDVGWVALHSNLANATDDVALYFKSSPFGSASHSHGEQNSFTLTAWNTPLAISSGYYDYYGSPHHNQFTRQTRSKNSILIDGAGQHYRSIEAAGEIVEFFTGAGYDFTAGQAAQAYLVKLDDFRREILFSVPDYFVIIDRLQAPNPAHYNWLLHTLAPPTLDADTQTVHVRQEKVGLQVRFLHPQELSFEVTDRFMTIGDKLTVYKTNEVPSETDQPTQYHLAATTPDASPHGFFVTVLQPYRQAAPDLQFTGSRIGGTYLVLAEGTGRQDVTLISVDGSTAELQGKGVAARAQMVAVSRQNGVLRKLLLKEGDLITLADAGSVKASRPITLSVEYMDEQVALAAQVSQAVVVELPMPRKPIAVLIDEVAVSDCTWEDGRLTIPLPAGEVRAQIGF